MIRRLVIDSPKAQPSKGVDELVQVAVEKRFKDYLYWIITVLLSAIFGAIIALIFDLNTKISEIVGKDKYQVEYVKILQDRVIKLEEANRILHDELRLKDKD